MKTIPDKRIESDVHLVIQLKDNGVPIAWDSLEIEQICMYSVEQKAFAGQCSYEIDRKDNHLLNVLYPASEQSYIGEHRIVARVKLHGTENTYDALAFSLKPYTDSEGSVDLGTVEVGIEVKEVDTTIMKEILTACQAATDKALQVEGNISEAERKRVEDERLRKEAEAARAKAEDLRIQAEASRGSAESLRSQAEAARTTAENLRVEAEAARAKAEDLRVKAEDARVKAESARSGNEAERAKAESLRSQAEVLRAQHESARAEAERLRATAETAREKAESLRSQAEAARVKAEDLRVKAEEARVAAEAARERATATAITEMKGTVNALTAGLFTLAVEDGELLAITNTEGSTFVGGGVSEDGEPYLEFNV